VNAERCVQDSENISQATPITGILFERPERLPFNIVLEARETRGLRSRKDGCCRFEGIAQRGLTLALKSDRLPIHLDAGIAAKEVGRTSPSVLFSAGGSKKHHKPSDL